MNLYLTLKSLCVAALITAAGAVSAQGGDFEGTWRQVKSNAGECRKCSLTITRVREGLTVVANNDWQALAIPVSKRATGDLPSALGTGVWKNGGQKKPMKIALIRNQDELQVLLIVGEGTGAQTIAATFRKRVRATGSES